MSHHLSNISKEKIAQGRIDAQLKKQALIDDLNLNFGVSMKTYYKMLPDTCKWGWLKSFFGLATKTQAIKAKCLDCCAYDRKEVELCNVPQCPLFKYRPFQKN